MGTRSSHSDIDDFHRRAHTLTRNQINFDEVRPLEIASAFMTIHAVLLKGAASFAYEGEVHLRKAADAYVQASKINQT